MREKGAQWLVTLCASVVHEWDKCATTILAFEVNPVVSAALAAPRSIARNRPTRQGQIRSYRQTGHPSCSLWANFDRV